jgi:DNA-binding beta-propeller fold protein YncE
MSDRTASCHRGYQALAISLLAWIFLVANAAEPVQAGSLYIPNWDGSTATQGNVLEFDALTGQFKRTLIPSVGSDLIPGMTLGPDRNLYLSVRDATPDQNGRVLRYSLNGIALGKFFIGPGEGGLEFPLGLRFGPDGSLYVTSNSLALDTILRFNGRSGRFEGVLASNLVTPQDIAFGPDGLLYVTNGTGDSVYRYNTVDDNFVGVFVPAGAGGLSRPIGLAFGPDRNLYIASFPNNAILRFDGSTGAFINVFASVADLDLDTPTDLVFGPDGNLYVLARSLTMPHSAVVRFNGATGVFIDVFIGVGSGGLGVTNTGMLFVDAGCSRYGDNGFTNRCFPAGK